MDLRAHARTELSAIADRIADAAEALLDQTRTDAETRIGALRDAADADAAKLQEDIKRLTSEVERLQSEIDSAATRASGTDAELLGTRELVDSARAEATRLADLLDAEIAQRALAEEHLAAAQVRLDAADAEIGSLRSSGEALTARVAQLTSNLTDAATREEDAARAAVDAQRGAETFRTELASARADADSLQGELAATQDALRHAQEALGSAQEAERIAATASAERERELASRLEQTERQTSAVLRAAIESADQLGAATSVETLFETLARTAGAHLPRVATFRVKGNHLEGEYGAGLDPTVDLSKLVIPRGVDSLIARAVGSNARVSVETTELEAAASPLGGSARGALAIAIPFEDAPFAALYADSDEPLTQTQITVAELLGRHALLVLSRLAREIRVRHEMREYAAMLLQEAEEMFHADVASACPGDQTIARLRASIDCARQLYAHRAELEGFATACLFEERITAALAQQSAFAQALSAALEHQRQRTAS